MCLSLNFFRILLHTFLGFVLVIFDIFGPFSHFFTCHFPQIILGWETQPKKIRQRGTNPISNMPHSNMHDFEFISNSMVHIFGICFGHFLTFLAIFSISSRVTPPKLFWVGKPSPNKFDELAYTLFRICPTQICMISNLFRTPLYIF